MNKYLQELKFGTGATYVLLAMNILVFIVAFGIRVFSPYSSVEVAAFLGGSNLFAILDGEAWRLITANFLQEDVFHFGFNMLGLYYYGRFVERFYSSNKMFIVYTICGIAGTALSLFYFNSITYGASASIWGFLGLIVGNSLRKNRYSPGLPIDTKQLLPSILLWLFIGFNMPGISGLGHLGGFIAGVVLGLILDTANSFRPDDWEDKVAPVLFYLCLGITVLSFIALPLSWIL